jgi:hypothetical protein
MWIGRKFPHKAGCTIAIKIAVSLASIGSIELALSGSMHGKSIDGFWPGRSVEVRLKGGALVFKPNMCWWRTRVRHAPAWFAIASTGNAVSMLAAIMKTEPDGVNADEQSNGA